MFRELGIGVAMLVAISVPLTCQAAELALKRVMLSAAGVGYFEYEAQADGPVELRLNIALNQVDDVLKSLVVFDSLGGVGTVTLPGHDDRGAAFGDVPFGPEALRSPLYYLNALQGVEISVQGARPMNGRIMRAQDVTETVPGGPNMPAHTVHRTRVSLMTADGLRQFVLEEAESVQIADPDLRARVGRALETLRRAPGQDMRQITLRANGAGKRTVRVGYVAGAPLWKTTYRMVLPAQGNGKARLQGWAVLENQTGSDWKDVALTLQYGNPVTFRQALYRSYFAQRPEVPVETLARILPDVDTRARALAATAGRRPEPAPMPKTQDAASERREVTAQSVRPMGGIAAPVEQVTATEGMEQTVFALPSPVTLPAGQSASVPILDREVPAARLSLASDGRPHPLASVRLANDSGLSLPAGVLTLYDPQGAAAFAGDARLGGLPAGENRLLAFAEDLRTGVERRTSTARLLVGVSAAKGVLRLTSRDRRTQEIVLTAPAREDRELLVEIPKQEDRKLTLEGGPIAGTMETATAWRLPVRLKAGEVRKLTAYLDRTLREDIALLEGDMQPVLVRVLASQELPPATRAALEGLAKLRQQEDTARAEIVRLNHEIQAVERDEDRIRRNLSAVRQSDALHIRLLRQLDADETRIGELRDQLEAANKAAEAARKALADAVATLRL